MALYTKSQFAEACGIKKKGSAYISTYIKRGKIILSGDYIDDQVPENNDFLQKQRAKNKSQANIETKKKARANKREIKPPEKPDIDPPNVEDPDYSGNIVGIDRKLKTQQLHKLKVDTRLLEIKEQKLRGTLIPTDLVKDFFTRYTKAIAGEFDNTLDKFITRIAGEFDIPNESQSKYRVEILNEINRMNEIAIEDTLNGINQIIDEFKETRGRGERK